jgi:hypothetical protein
MSASPRVSLTKACSHCIKAKRKCSRALPKCQRCAKQSLSCQYKNAPMKGCNRSLAARTEAVVSAFRDDQTSQSSMRHLFDGKAPANHALTGSPTSDSTDVPSTASLSCFQLAPPDVIMTWDQPTLDYLTGHLKSSIGMFAHSGKTTFIHPDLYRGGFSPQLRNVFTLCCVHSCLNQDNYEIASEAIAYATANLIASIPSAYTFMALLELVQSLILLQIITLLYPDLSQTLRSQASNRMALLESLTDQLFQSVPAHLPSSLSPYQAWLLAESVRRTIYVASKIRALHSVKTCGHFVLTSFVEALPFSQRGYIWECGSSLGKDASFDPDLISYRELVDKWDLEGIRQLDLFEEILIVACKGAPSPYYGLHQF